MNTLSTSMFIRKDEKTSEPKKSINLSSSLQDEDNQLKSLFLGTEETTQEEREKLPFHLPMCENCLYDLKNTLTLQEVSFTNSYCELIRLRDDVAEMSDIDERIKKEEEEVNKLCDELSKLYEERELLNQKQEMFNMVRDLFKQQTESHSSLCTELVKGSTKVSRSFHLYNFKEEKRSLQQEHKGTVWDFLYPMEWDEDGPLVCSISIVQSYYSVCHRLNECFIQIN